jgi:hypothetical protein
MESKALRQAYSFVHSNPPGSKVIVYPRGQTISPTTSEGLEPYFAGEDT